MLCTKKSKIKYMLNFLLCHIPQVLSQVIFVVNHSYHMTY